MEQRVESFNGFYKSTFIFSNGFVKAISVPETLDVSDCDMYTYPVNSSNGFGNIQSSSVLGHSFPSAPHLRRNPVPVKRIVFAIWEQLKNGNELLISDGRLNVFLCLDNEDRAIPCCVSFLNGKWFFGLIDQTDNDWVNVGRIIFT